MWRVPEQIGGARTPPQNRAASLTSDSEAVGMNVTEKKRSKTRRVGSIYFYFLSTNIMLKASGQIPR